MEFTEEEISLCKQVAEEYRRFPKKGDWEYNDSTKETILRTRGYMGVSPPQEVNVFLLWTISDCLEFLREKEYSFERAYQLGGIFNVSFISGEGTKKGSGDTLLEACLRAVLAVVVKGA